MRSAGYGLDTDLPTHNTGAILYVHGGGFVFGSIQSHRALTAWLAHHSKIPVFRAQYRLAPEHRYPFGVENIVAAYAGLLATGLPPDWLVISGDPAGAHVIAAALAEMARRGLAVPRAVALFSPFLDLTCADMIERDSRRRDPFGSPAYALRAAGAYLGHIPSDDPRIDVLGADLSNWPRTLIQVGGTECMLGDSERLANKLAAAGVSSDVQVWTGQVHVFQAFAGVLPEGRLALKATGEFLNRAIAE